MQSYDSLSRRDFITCAARTYLGVSLGVGALGTSCALAKRKETAAAKSVIYLNMRGGMSHIDTFDPKPKHKSIQGPVEVIGTKTDGIQLSEYLPKTAALTEHLCIINSMNSTQGAHEQGQYLLQRSFAPRNNTDHPTLGAWTLKHLNRLNPEIPGFVSIAGTPEMASPGFFGSKYAGVPLGSAAAGLQNSHRADSVNTNDFKKRVALADALNQNFHERTHSVEVEAYDALFEEALRLMHSQDLKAFDLHKEPEHLKVKYGKHRFGQGCLLARRLVEHQVRFVEVSLGGWDTHYDNFAGVAARCQVLDRAYAALLQDLAARGLLDSTLVVLSTEFGRTPEIQADKKNGRDHYPSAYSAVLAGGGVKGGQKYGETDSKGGKIKKGKTTPQQLNATIAHALGIDPLKVIRAPNGRPFTMSDKAKPIKSIF